MPHAPLFEAIDRLEAAERKRLETDGPTVPAPDSAELGLVDDLIIVAAQTDDDSLRPIRLAVFNLARERLIFLARQDDLRATTGHGFADVGSQYPHAGFMVALAAVFEARHNPPRELPPLEPIKRLDQDGVSHAQIGRMWGIEAWQVKSELAEPGSIIKAGHVTPVDRQRAEARRLEDLQIKKLPMIATSLQQRRLLEQEQEQEGAFVDPTPFLTRSPLTNSGRQILAHT